MGDWALDDNGRWQYDANAPSPSAEVIPLAPRAPEVHPSLFEKPGGMVYGRVDPAQFASFDEVDSTAIEDDDGPPDAA